MKLLANHSALFSMVINVIILTIINLKDVDDVDVVVAAGKNFL